MTLLSIAQDAADEIGITRPGTVITSTQPEVQQLLRLANKVGDKMMKSFAWQVLRSEQTYTALNQEEQTSILPTGFDRFIPETFWDRTNAQLVTGPISSVEWGGLKAGGYTGSRKYILRGGSVSVIPAPAGGEDYAFEYVSNQWAESSVGAGQTSFAADTDVSRIDEELMTLGLIYEFLQRLGQPSGDAGREYQSRFDMLTGNDQPSTPILTSGDIFGGGRRFSGAPTTQSAGSIL